MNRDEYCWKVCPGCVNYNYKKNGEPCFKGDNNGMCKNYRKIKWENKNDLRWKK